MIEGRESMEDRIDRLCGEPLTDKGFAAIKKRLDAQRQIGNRVGVGPVAAALLVSEVERLRALLEVRAGTGSDSALSLRDEVGHVDTDSGAPGAEVVDGD